MAIVSKLPVIDRSMTLVGLAGFSEQLAAMMSELREQLLAPKPRKNPPVFTSSMVATLCGIDRARINYLATKEGATLPPGELQGNGRSRQFTLAEARQWVQAESGRVQRPAGVPGEIMLIANFKGGSTKTTTAMCLAQGLSLLGRKVLMLDLDPQGSATELCGFYAERDVLPADTVLPFIYGEESSLNYAIKPTYWDGLDVIPASRDLFDAEFSIPHQVIADNDFQFWDILGNGLRPLCQEYDYIIIDTAPALSYLTLNAFMAANAMIMPLVPETLDFASSVQFWRLVSDVTKSFIGVNPNKSFDFISILLSRVDYSPSSAAPVVRSWAQRAYGDWVLPVEIPASSVAGGGALELATVYDITKWEGSMKTLQRIRDPFDRLCQSIDDGFIAKWSKS